MTKREIKSIILYLDSASAAKVENNFVLSKKVKSFLLTKCV